MTNGLDEESQLVDWIQRRGIDHDRADLDDLHLALGDGSLVVAGGFEVDDEVVVRIRHIDSCGYGGQSRRASSRAVRMRFPYRSQKSALATMR